MHKWQTKKLGEVVDILDNLRKPVTARDRVAGPFPYYGATGIQDYVNDYIFDEELVLVGEDGARWDAGDNTAFAISGKTWVNNHAHVLRPHKDVLLDQWLIYFLNISDLSRYITGTTVKKLNQEKLRSIEIPLPPLDEQKKIVKVLDEKMGKIGEAKRLRADALADTEKILPQTLHEIFEEGKKNGLEEKIIGEISLQIKSGFACGKQNEVSDGVVHLRTHNISLDGEINLDKIVRIPQKFVDSDVFTLKKDDIIFNNTNSVELVGKTILIHEDLPYAFSNHLTRMRFNNEIVIPAWVLYVFQKYWADKVFEKMCTRWIGQAGINQTALKNIKILIPPLAEQQKIVAKLDALSEKVRTLRDLQTTQLADLKSLERAYLREVFQNKV